MRFDASRPSCDGILYSDLWRLRSADDRLAMVGRGLVYVTEFQGMGGVEMSGDVIAKSWKDARAIAFGRGLDERVVRHLEAGDYVP